jgi:hypothetical protein
MARTCLIIDDEPQDAVIENIETRLRGKYVNVECLQFNVGSLERKDLMTDEKIDMVKVLKQFEIEFKGKRLDLICIDYNLEDDKINGLEILKEIYPFRQTSLFMMYSSNLDQLVKKIIDSYDEDRDKRKLLNKIKLLTRYRIEEFSARNSYDEAVITLLSKNRQTLEAIIEEKLLEYPDLIFHNTYPVFEGKTLAEIVEEIRIGSVHGNHYMKELIEQAISNMVLINS